MLRSEDWERIDELFDAALDLPPESRKRWLDAVCESEPDLREQVGILLEFTDSEDERLSPNPVAAELVRELVSRLQARGILAACSTNPPAISTRKAPGPPSEKDTPTS